MQYLVIMLVSTMMLLSLWQYITFQYRRKSHRLRISFELFYTLIIIYTLVITGFGIIYFMLSLHTEVLIETGQVYPVPVTTSLLRSIYFSGVTMLTIGYGDIVPIEAARLIAIMQALLGYLLPTTFVLKLMQLNMEREINRHKNTKK